MNMQEMRAIKLPWHELGEIFSEMIADVLGIQIQCKAIAKEGLWWPEFVDYRMPLPELCRLVQTLHPTVEDWEDALPDEGEADVKTIGMYIAEKLLGKHLDLTWEHSLVTANGLLLVGATDSRSSQPQIASGECRLTDDLAQAIKVIASHLYGKEPSCEQE